MAYANKLRITVTALKNIEFGEGLYTDIAYRVDEAKARRGFNLKEYG
jgi:hypothetical protein